MADAGECLLAEINLYPIEKFREGASPKEIQGHYPHLTLKQIYATITYYLFNKKGIDAYIEAGYKRMEAAYCLRRPY